ncbi:MAG: acetylxylan esterase [Planctomycetota bacterium]|nr:acetylxylan esterase [Planctomycetota bacterium]
MRKKRKLLTWDRQPGFLCDWHLCGWFDSGLQHNPEPNLFDPKVSDRWTEDHLLPWGGCAQIRDVPKPGKQIGLAADWTLLPLAGHPTLSLLGLREAFPSWEATMRERDPDAWHKLYYALAVVESPAEHDAALVFSGWDGCRLWVNGALAFEEHSYHHPIVDHERIPVRLTQGLNTFLFQLDRDGVVARLEIPGDPAALETLRSVAAGTPPELRAIGAFAPMTRYALGLKVKRAFKGSTKEDLAKWQKGFGAFYRKCLGPAPVYPKKRPAPQLVSEEKLDGYTRRRFHLACEGGGLIPAWVLAPDAARFNGRSMAIAHGHENPLRTVGVVPASGPRIASGKQTHNYAEQMARHGFFTVMINERAFGERRDCFGSADPCNVAHMKALAMGLTLPRLHIADLHLLYDFACTFPEVDRNRIGLSGLSGGGTLTYVAGAFDERFKAVGVFCGLIRYEDYAASNGGCGMQTIPGLYPTVDVGEVLSLIAPRPLLLGQGRLDSGFPITRFKSMAEDARKAYRAAGVEDRLQVSVFELAHQYDPEISAEFFTKWL